MRTHNALRYSVFFCCITIALILTTRLFRVIAARRSCYAFCFAFAFCSLCSIVPFSMLDVVVFFDFSFIVRDFYQKENSPHEPLRVADFLRSSAELVFNTYTRAGEASSFPHILHLFLFFLLLLCFSCNYNDLCSDFPAIALMPDATALSCRQYIATHLQVKVRRSRIIAFSQFVSISSSFFLAAVLWIKNTTPVYLGWLEYNPFHNLLNPSLKSKIVVVLYIIRFHVQVVEQEGLF